MDSRQLEKLIYETDLKLKELKQIDYVELDKYIVEIESRFHEFKESACELLKSGEILQIGIVGQVKAGKSSFLNSMFFNGHNILPKASTPMTAGLTIIEYSPDNAFEIEYFSQEEWDIFVRQDKEYKKIEAEILENNPGIPQNIAKKQIEEKTSLRIRSAHEMVSKCTPAATQKIGKNNDIMPFNSIDELQDVLEKYVGANGEYTSVVKSLYVKLKDERLKGLKIVDTPGVNDPIVSRENRTRQFLQSCHGVFLLSSSSDFLGSGDIGFLNSRIGGAGIGSVVILASKFDSVLQDVGAEHVMKQEPPEDLVEAAENQIKKFKRRLRELQPSIIERLQNKMKIDTTSGIGYSIARKSEKQWDDIECKVVSQMRRFYNEYFDTEEHLKESFNWLANIDDNELSPGIRSKFLEGEFLKHKESIITSRINEFFNTSREDIYDTINSITGEFQNRYDVLKAATIDEIEKQKQLQKKLFESLKSTFNLSFTKFMTELQNQIKHLNNSIEFNAVRIIPTEEATVDFTCKGMMWGHNSKTLIVEQINTYELGKLFEKSINDYISSWNNQWMNIFRKNQESLVDKLTDSISSFQKDIMSSVFNDNYYRNLIDEALNDLSSSRELSVGSLQKKYKDLGFTQAKIYEPTGTYDLKESDARSHINSSLRKYKEQLLDSYSNLSDALISDIKIEVEKQLKNSVKIMDSLKSSFSNNLEKEGEEYLQRLEEDSKNKKDILEQIDQIIQIFKQLNALYN